MFPAPALKSPGAWPGLLVVAIGGSGWAQAVGDALMLLRKRLGLPTVGAAHEALERAVAKLDDDDARRELLAVWVLTPTSHGRG
jgi:hypothetical protein